MGFGVSDFGLAVGLGFRILGLGVRILGMGCRV